MKELTEFVRAHLPEDPERLDAIEHLIARGRDREEQHRKRR